MHTRTNHHRARPPGDDFSITSLCLLYVCAFVCACRRLSVSEHIDALLSNHPHPRCVKSPSSTVTRSLSWHAHLSCQCGLCVCALYLCAHARLLQNCVCVCVYARLPCDASLLCMCAHYTSVYVFVCVHHTCVCLFT